MAGEAAGYAHSGELSEAALRRAAATVGAVRQGRSGTLDVAPRATNARLYEDANPLGHDGVRGQDRPARRRSTPMPAAATRACVQVMATLVGEWQAVQIIRAPTARASPTSARWCG